MEENEEAWELWQAIGTQWRTGGFGVVGLDYNVLFRVAEVLEIEVTKPLLQKIQALEAEVLKQQVKQQGHNGRFKCSSEGT